MKYFILFLGSLFSLTAQSQIEFGTAYTLGVPVQKMSSYLQPAHQAVVQANYNLPISKLKNLWVGVEGGAGMYGNKTINQHFEFSDGSVTTTDVKYTNNIEFVNAVIRYDIPTKGRATPYANIKGGYVNLATDINIENPDDPDGCNPLEHKRVFHDNTFTYSYGAGVRYNVCKQAGDKYQLDFAISNTYGGKLDYINVKELGKHQHEPNSESSAKAFNAKFINVNTQSVHEHQLAEVYNSPFRMLQIKFGFVMRL